MGKKEDEQQIGAGCGCLLIIGLVFGALLFFASFGFIGKTEADKQREHELKMEELRLKYDKEKTK